MFEYGTCFQVCLGWELGEVHKNVNISGFRVLINGEQLGHMLARNTRRTTIDKLKPGTGNGPVKELFAWNTIIMPKNIRRATARYLFYFSAFIPSFHII